MILGAAASNVFADDTLPQAVVSSTNDAALSRSVKTLLVDHPDLGWEYTVSARHGVVYLYGLFATNLEKADAMEFAMEVKGVKDVVDLAGVSN
jgi:osmotically-inducible protein OsmY